MRKSIVIMLFLVASPAAADPKSCVTIDADTDRLACFDKEFGRPSKNEAAFQRHGHWVASEQKSPLRDTSDVFLLVSSNEAVNCRWNNGEKISFVVRCFENTTAAYFQTGCHMTSSRYDRYGDIEYRVDTQKAKIVNGNASTDNRALGLWTGGNSIPFLKEMLSGNRLIVRMTPYGESPFTATFNISGLEEVIQPLRKACKW